MAEICSGSEAGSYLRLIDSCVTQLKAQGPSSKEVVEEEEEKEETGVNRGVSVPIEGLLQRLMQQRLLFVVRGKQ